MITFHNIKVVFDEGSDSELTALDIPELKIDEKKWCNIIGPNGSGKTTLLNIICGKIPELKGEVFVDNNKVDNKHSNRNYSDIQIVEQDPKFNIVPSMTIKENLQLYAFPSTRPALKSLSSVGIKEIKDLLSRFNLGLEDRLYVQGGLLSGGQKQALALAGVLLRKPKILLLDEYLASIDAKTVPLLQKIVKELVTELNITVIMVSHNLEEVLSVGDRIIILSNGKIADDIQMDQKIITKEYLINRYTSVMKKNGVI